MGLPNSNPPFERMTNMCSRRNYRPLHGLYCDVEIRLDSVDSGINVVRERIREFERLMDDHASRCEAVEQRIKALREQFGDIDQEITDMLQQCEDAELNRDAVGEDDDDDECRELFDIEEEEPPQQTSNSNRAGIRDDVDDKHVLTIACSSDESAISSAKRANKIHEGKRKKSKGIAPGYSSSSEIAIQNIGYHQSPGVAKVPSPTDDMQILSESFRTTSAASATRSHVRSNRSKYVVDKRLPSEVDSNSCDSSLMIDDNPAVAEQDISTYTRTALLQTFSEGQCEDNHNNNISKPVKFHESIHKRSESLVESVRKGKVVYPKVLKAYISSVKDTVSCHGLLESRSKKLYESDELPVHSQKRDIEIIQKYDAGKSDMYNRGSAVDQAHYEHSSIPKEHEHDGHNGERDCKDIYDNSTHINGRTGQDQLDKCMDTVLAVYIDRFLQILQKHTEREVSRKSAARISRHNGQIDDLPSSSYFPCSESQTTMQESNYTPDRDRIRKAFCKRLGFKSGMLPLIEDFRASHHNFVQDTFEPRHATDEEVKRLLTSLEKVSRKKDLHKALRIAVATVHVLMSNSSGFQR